MWHECLKCKNLAVFFAQIGIMDGVWHLMKSWVIYVHEDGRYTGLHVRCPHSAVSYGVHVLHISWIWNRATRRACIANSHFEPSDLHNGLANWYTRPIFPPCICPGNEPRTGFPIAISDHHLKYLKYIHIISPQPRIWPKGMLNAVTRNAQIGWDRACQYIALIVMHCRL